MVIWIRIKIETGIFFFFEKLKNWDRDLTRSHEPLLLRASPVEKTNRLIVPRVINMSRFDDWSIPNHGWQTGESMQKFASVHQQALATKKNDFLHKWFFAVRLRAWWGHLLPSAVASEGSMHVSAPSTHHWRTVNRLLDASNHGLGGTLSPEEVDSRLELPLGTTWRFLGLHINRKNRILN